MLRITITRLIIVRLPCRSVLHKFNVNSKADLRADLANWDFNAWLEAQYMRLTDNSSSKTPASPQ
jgi:hypothetical protein